MAHALENAPIEFAVGPHPARGEWSVLRVSYRNAPAHEARVVRAIDALLGDTNTSAGPDDDTTKHAFAEQAARQASVTGAPLTGVR